MTSIGKSGFENPPIKFLVRLQGSFCSSASTLTVWNEEARAQRSKTVNWTEQALSQTTHKIAWPRRIETSWLTTNSGLRSLRPTSMARFASETLIVVQIWETFHAGINDLPKDQHIPCRPCRRPCTECHNEMEL